MTSFSKEPSLAYSNESKIRLTAFFVLLLILWYWATRSTLILAFLIIDFGFRSFDKGKFSPLAVVSEKLAAFFRLPVKPVLMPPKRFAARIGFGVTILILLLHLTGNNTLVLSGVIGGFAALESLAGFCAGCYIFDLLQRFKKSKPFS